MLYDMFFRCGVAVFTAYLSAFAFKRLAFKWDILDCPTEKRKVHDQAIPLLGGASIVLGVLVALLLCTHCSWRIAILLLAAFGVFAVNLADDARGLSARVRFFVESVLALIVIIFADARISFLPPGFLGDTAEIIITWIWFVGITNAVNYLDGLDGLASGLSMIAAIFFASMLLYTRQHDLGLTALVLAGAVLGFIPHNFPKATMFLGDAGSTFLGFMLAGLGVMGDWATYDAVRIAAPVLVLGVPIFDMTFTTITRIMDDKVHNIKEWLAYAGRDHFHHLLIELGFSRKEAVVFIWSTCVVLGMTALLVRKSRDVAGVVAILQGALVLAMIGVLLRVGKNKQSGWHKD